MTPRLDDAIDHVAARMTSVKEDAAFASRIADALPERRTGLRWMLAGWAPRLAALAFAITVVLRTFDEGSTMVLRVFDEGSTPVLRTEDVTLPSAPTAVEPSSNTRRTIVEPSSNARRTPTEAERPDHERSLAPIEVPGALSLEPLALGEMALQPALELEPLVMTDLPFGAEFSHR